jgi:hypothetical protein
MDYPLDRSDLGALHLGVDLVTIWLTLLHVPNVCFWPEAEAFILFFKTNDHVIWSFLFASKLQAHFFLEVMDIGTARLECRVGHDLAV